MSSPTNFLNRYAALYDWAGSTISHKLRYRFPSGKTTILDVGAGWGKYRELFPDYIMDACEIWGPYIVEELLEARYRHVYHDDICTVVKQEGFKYDVLIFGDVFEHISRVRAKELLADIKDKCEEVYIVVPYLYAQGAVDNNPYEKHEQADLTPEVMKRRYPELKLVDSDGAKGLYLFNDE